MKPLQYIIILIKSSKIRCPEHAVCILMMRNAYKCSQMTGRERPLADEIIDRRIILKYFEK
jgi:hypothetical protein